MTQTAKRAIQEKDNFLTYEEGGEKFRVFIRKEKRLRHKKEKNKKSQRFEKKKRVSVNDKNESNIKGKSIDPTSPFASLKVLLKN